MTDSYQNQAISSAWIGKRVCVKGSKYGILRYLGEIITAHGNWCGVELDESLGENDGKIDTEKYFVCKDKHGIFVPISEIKQVPCEIGQNFENNFSNELMNFISPRAADETHFSFDLSVENDLNKNVSISLPSDLENNDLHKTFDISTRNANKRKISYENRLSGAILDKTIDFSTLNSRYLPEKCSSDQLHSDEFGAVLDKTLDLSTLKCEYLPEKCSDQLNSDEFGAVLDKTLDLSTLKCEYLPEKCSGQLNSDEFGAVLDKTIDLSTLKCEYLPEKRSFDQLQSEKFGAILNKTVNLQTLKSECILKNNTFTRLDSEESLGILPDTNFNGSWDLLTSCSKLLNLGHKKTSMTEVHDATSDTLSHRNCYDFKRLQSGSISSVGSYVNEARCTSTPKQLMNYVNLDTSDVFSQDLNHSPLQDEVKVDEPILAGSSQIPSKMCFDVGEFERGTILTSTSKISVLQIPHLDLNKTSNVNVKETFFEGPFEINDEFEKLESSRTICHTNVLNNTFELKPISPKVFSNKTYLGASPDLNCITINETISADNLSKTSAKEVDAVGDSNCDTISIELNKTKISNSSNDLYGQLLSNTILEVLENQNNVQLSKCSDPANGIIDQCQTSLTLNLSPRKCISLPINSSVDSLQTEIRSTNLTFELNSTFCMNNGNASPTEQSTSKPFNRRCSLSALPAFQKASFLKMDLLKRPLPISSKLDNAHKSKPGLSVSKVIGVETKKPKKSMTTTTACLPKSAMANVFGMDKGSMNTCKSLNGIAIKRSAVASEKLEVNKESLKSRFAIPAIALNDSFNKNILKHSSSPKENMKNDRNTFSKSYTKINDFSKENPISFASGEFHGKEIKKPSLNDTYNKRDIPKHSSSGKEKIKTDPSTFSNSCVEIKDYSKDNQTSDSELPDNGNTTVNKQEKCEIAHEILGKSICDPIVKIKKLSAEKSVTGMVNLTKTKRDDSTINILDKNCFTLPSDSLDKSLKGVLEKSAVKNKNIKISKTVNRPRFSLVPTSKLHVSNNLSSESKDACKKMGKEKEFQDHPGFSSKQCSRRSILAPRFHLKSSAENMKNTVRFQEKSILKENTELNPVSLGIKNTKPNSHQMGNSKFCHTGRILKPTSEKASKVVTAEIHQRESLDAVELKSNQSSKIPSFGARRMKKQLNEKPGESRPQSYLMDCTIGGRSERTRRFTLCMIFKNRFSQNWVRFHSWGCRM